MTRDELEAIKSATAEFARRELTDNVAQRDRDGSFSRGGWQACANFGIPGLPIPPIYGGSGATMQATLASLEGLGTGSADNGLLFALNAQMWSLEVPLLRFGTPTQKQRYLPGLCAGTLIGGHAMTEPDSGSDAFGLRTRAEARADHYVLNGRKIFVTNAPVADVVLVFATLDPQLGLGGITGFLVDRDAPGLHLDRELDNMGLRTTPMGEFVLDECVVPAGQRLGKEGGGAAIFNVAMEWERAGILATSVGGMQRELSRCVEFARVRHQFSQPISKFPSVSARLADMQVRLSASRALLRQVGELIDSGKPAAMEATVTKLFISEAWVQSSLDAQQIYGAYGYMRENGIEREIRDALAARIFSGTSDLQRVIIARWLGL
jgi:hypothetical protein